VPGEPFESIEREIVGRTGQKHLRVVGYSNGAPGYVFRPDEEHEGGYEVLSSPLTGEAGPRIVATGLEAGHGANITDSNDYGRKYHEK
jgi:hypothetical protein